MSTSADRKAGTAQAVVLIACTILPIMGIVSLAPVLPLLLEQFAATPRAEFLVPVALTVPGLCIALLSAPFGVLADRRGRIRLLLAGLVIYAAFGVMPMFLDSLPAIVGTRIGLGVAEALIMTTTTALVGDYFGGNDRQKWIAIQAAAGSLLASALFAAGGALGQISWRAPFLLYLLALPAALAVLRWLWEPQGEAGAAAAARRDEPMPPFPRNAFIGVCAFTVFAAMAFYVAPIHLGRVLGEVGVTEPARIGMVTGLGSLGVPVGAAIFKKLGHWQVSRLLGIAMLLVGAPLMGMYWAEGFGAVFALFFISQLGCGLLLPTVIGWCLSHLPFVWRGRGSGLWNSTFFVAQFLTPLAFALSVKGSGSVLGAMFVFGGAALATAVVIAISPARWGAAGTPQAQGAH